jgi:hypothetical protein
VVVVGGRGGRGVRESVCVCVRREGRVTMRGKDESHMQERTRTGCYRRLSTSRSSRSRGDDLQVVQVNMVYQSEDCAVNES